MPQEHSLYTPGRTNVALGQIRLHIARLPLHRVVYEPLIMLHWCFAIWDKRGNANVEEIAL